MGVCPRLFCKGSSATEVRFTRIMQKRDYALPYGVLYLLWKIPKIIRQIPEILGKIGSFAKEVSLSEDTLH